MRKLSESEVQAVAASYRENAKNMQRLDSFDALKDNFIMIRWQNDHKHPVGESFTSIYIDKSILEPIVKEYFTRKTRSLPAVYVDV